ncbi:MAG TPA: hypothetical protein VFY85_07055 [Gemmatimonadaceae bacterium]|nr:hypothetical protein [Gemmatimonadaceae bacterium]
MTSVAEWLGRREPAPPAALLLRLREALGHDAERDAGDAADACLAAGERLLAKVLREGDASRDHALDLLAADALVTYAFEAASGRPDALPALAARAMARMATLGGADVATTSAAHA